MRAVLVAAGAVVVLAAAGCGDEQMRTAGAEPTRSSSGSASASSGGTTAVETRHAEPDFLPHPPAVEVSGGGGRLTLRPFTFCLAEGGHSGCADGLPPDPLSDLGATESFVVSYPVHRFGVSALGRPAQGGDCREWLAAETTEVDGGWRVRPAGPAGRYDMTIDVAVPQGEMTVAFALTTTQDRPWPAPTAALDGLYGRHDPGAPPAWGRDLTLHLQHLGGDLSPGGARVKLSGPLGEATVALSGRGAGCDQSVRLHGRTPPGTVTDMLGEPPYRVRVELALDGQRRVASAVWPRDRNHDDQTSLRFNPALPAR